MFTSELTMLLRYINVYVLTTLQNRLNINGVVRQNKPLHAHGQPKRNNNNKKYVSTFQVYFARKVQANKKSSIHS